MASEYLKWKYKDVKPDPEPEYTKAEKRRNWWDYNVGWVILGVIAAIVAFFLIKDILLRVKPDYQIGCVVKAPLSDQVREALEEQLTQFGEDVNGDRKVVVEVLEYDIGFDEDSVQDAQVYTAGITRLAVDMGEGGVFIVLLDDPEGFQSHTGLLSYLDGSVPSEEAEGFESENWRQMVYAWPDCPVLSSLDLGAYQQYTAGLQQQESTVQSALQPLYAARRVIVNDDQAEKYAPSLALWETLTSGATPLD